ncbi:unnamed protein product [Mycena citricolor]|uniref:DUF6535 domain-containing protein n=1 Tax=Mycena citricolor TaxID=2018698 RepID=A0AAD2K4P4_9AGAR|nr:unnamed protein product [Mycena citricolor]
MSPAAKQQADEGAVEKSQTHGSQSGERLPAEPQTDESQSEESQADESQADERQSEDSQTKESQTEESQTEESQADEPQYDEPQPPEVQTKGAQADQRQAEEERLERERASGNKLWSAYIAEAQNYDQGLLEGWRSEMDGLLIFAGLFSGVITTFIIDSYKTLNPDSRSQTVVLLRQTVILLTQISQQLANMNNGTAMADALPPAAAFSPPVSSLVCNALWFTSLALSLSSAFIAMRVKHRVQHFPHRTAMFPTVFTQSCMCMYLHGGSRRFNAKAPLLLLHAALVLFFVGLVAFLAPVSVIVMSMFAAILLFFTVFYGIFTGYPSLLGIVYANPFGPCLYSTDV